MRTRWIYWVTGLAATLALIAGSLFLGDLNQDEGWYLYGAYMVSRGFMPFVDFATTQGPVMPLVYALAQPWVDAWGVAGGRLFTALLGLGTAFLAARLAAVAAGREGGGSQRSSAALVAFLLCGVNTFQAYYMTVVKTYALAGLLVTAGLVLFLKPGARGGFALAGGVLAGLATATRISLGFAVAAAAVAVFFAGGEGSGAEATFRRRRAVLFAVGAAVAMLGAFLPFALWAPEGVRFALFEYHSGRDVGGVGTWLAYKAGFVSRLCLDYAVALFIAAGLVLDAVCRRPWKGRGAAGVLAAARPEPVAIWVAVVAVSAVHLAAPFPYDDYQAVVYPLLCAGLGAAMARRLGGWGDFECRGWCAGLPAWILVVSLMSAVASPVLQGWFIGKRDRIWWPVKEKSPLRVLQETAAYLRNDLGMRSGEVLLTQDPYLAVEAGLTVPRGLELGQFSYFPDWSEEKAGACRVLNGASFRRLLRTDEARVAAFSGYGLSIKSPGVSPLPDAEQRELWEMVLSRYRPVRDVDPFGQADTRLRILERK